MFRRSRFSVRPNVGAVGRAATTAAAAPPPTQEAPPVNKEAAEASKDTTESISQDQKLPAEKPTVPGDGNDPNGEGTSTSAAVQRRKRFSIKPKVAPGRPSALARTPKSPVKAISETPAEAPGSDLDPAAAPRGLQSPRRRRPSESSKQPAAPPGPAASHVSSAPAAAPPDDSTKQTPPSADGGKKSEKPESQVKELPKVPPSLPDKEVVELSEKAKTLLSSKSETSQAKFSLCRLLNDPSDVQRLEKARKLRQLLKQELHKEKKLKAKARAKEYTMDPAKMTMRDLIRYLPMSNPMSSSTEDPTQENETIIPPSPAREQSPERAPAPEPEVTASPREEAEEDTAAAAAAAAAVAEEEEDEDALMVPQVKVAEDGSLIIDEESLTVEVQRAKGPNTVQDRDPIFERGSTTTYSSFRKGINSKPWSPEETDMFFLAISMVGTDFSMICQLFPHRARLEIKNKFKKEERENAWRVDKAFRERRKLDIEYFSKLLQKILEVQKSRKKLKSLSEKNSPKKRQRKTKGTKRKKASRKLSDVEEEDEEEEDDENELPTLEGEKENEELRNEGGAAASKPKKKRARPCEEDASTEGAKAKNNQDDVGCISDDTEAAPEDQSKSNTSKNGAGGSAVKPVKLLRGRPAKRFPPLGTKRAQKSPRGDEQEQDGASEQEEENPGDGALKEQVNKGELPDGEKRAASDDASSDDENYNPQPSKPTRYGRMPKPPKPLNYPAKEDAHSSASEAAAASPNAKPKPKRRRAAAPKPAEESKRPKLITLKASQSEDSDDDEHGNEDDALMGQWPAAGGGGGGGGSAFVPASLRSPNIEICEVEETMEELDILATMPDVLGISQDALCPDASCERAQNETGTAEPCEHQLDLLVDVIDFLSSEQTGVSEAESYNEAAHTLLTIGNMAHLSQSATQETSPQDSQAALTTARQPLEEEIVANLLGTGSTSAALGQGDVSETVAAPDPPTDATNTDCVSRVDDAAADQTRREQSAASETDSAPPPPSKEKSSPQARRGRLPKVKPRPNLDRTARTGQLKSKTEANPGSTTGEGRASTADISADNQSSSVSGDQCGSEVPTTDTKSHSGTTQSDDNPAASDVGVIQSETEQGSNANSDAVRESSDAHAKPAEEVTIIPVGEPADQTKKARFQKVKPRPNLPQTSRNKQSKPQNAGGRQGKDADAPSDLDEGKPQPMSTLSETSASSLTLPADLASSHEPQGLSPPAETETHVAQVHSNAASEEPGASPDLAESGSGPTSEPKSTDNKLAESRPAPVPSAPEKHPSINSEDASSAEGTKPDAGSQLDSETAAPGAAQRRRRFPKAKPNLGSPARKVLPNVQPRDEGGSSSSSVNSVQPPGDADGMQIQPEEASTLESKVESVSADSENTEAQCSKIVPEIVHQETAQQSPKTEQTPTDKSEVLHCPPEPNKHSTASTKPPENRRGRLVRPKPNLGRGGRPPQPERVQNVAPADTGSGAASEGTAAPSPQPDIRSPVKEVVEHAPQGDGGSSLGCATQAPELSTQDLEASSGGESQSLENLPIFQDMLSAPSDPDEPFFILSLTEIPICPSGEVADSVPEPRPYLATTDASAQQQSIVSGSGLAAGGEGPPPVVLEPAPREDAAEKQSSVGTNPVDPNESATVSPLSPVETGAEADAPAPKTRPGAEREGKPQVEPCAAGTKPAPETLADARGAGDGVEADEGIQSEKRNAGESGSAAQAPGSSRTSTLARKPKGFLSFLSASSSSSSSDAAPRGRAASRGRGVRAPRGAARGRSAREPAAPLSQPLSAAPAPVPTPSDPPNPPTRQTPADVTGNSSSQFAPEVSVSQESVASGSTEEEPMSVSQYFLSDIFTDVEEG